jgi:hypothetical protein
MPRSIDELLEEVRARYERVDAVTAALERDGGALLVDTRPVEYRREHGEIPGAITIGLDILEWRLDPQCPPASRCPPPRDWCETRPSKSCAFVCRASYPLGSDLLSRRHERRPSAPPLVADETS